MSNNNNQINVPEAKEAMNRSREAGSVGGQMVNVMWHVRQTDFMRSSSASREQIGRVVYTYGLAV